LPLWQDLKQLIESNIEDFESLKEGVSWWYNWNWNTTVPENYNQDYQMKFIPMLWGY
jgi:hypothetical protein